MIKRCIGCGVELQSLDESKAGYVKDLNFDYCQRCFRVNNYNENVNLDLNYSNDEIINKLNKKAALSLFLADFITLDSGIINTFKKINTKKVLVINKSDLLPKSIKEERIIDFIRETYSIIDKIVIISTLKKKNIAVIKNLIENNNGTYVAGFTNAGKSSLIKTLLSKYTKKKANITTSIMPNTTLDFIKVKFNETVFYDCPGFNNESSFISNKNLKLVKKANSKKEIKPITMQVKVNDIINIDNIVYIKSDKDNSMTFYMGNDFVIKKIYENIECNNYLNVKDNTDVIIRGIGFINIKKKATLELSIKLDEVEVRSSIFEVK